MNFTLLRFILVSHIWLIILQNAFAFTPSHSGKEIKVVPGDGIQNQQGNQVHINTQKDIEEYMSMETDSIDNGSEQIGDWLVCPITKRIMRDPVITISDGHTYERDAIELWLKRGHTISPLTGNTLSSIQTIPNFALRQSIKQILINEPSLASDQYNPNSYNVLEAVVNKKERELNLMLNREKSEDKILSQVEISQDIYQSGNIEIIDHINPIKEEIKKNTFKGEEKIQETKKIESKVLGNEKDETKIQENKEDTSKTENKKDKSKKNEKMKKESKTPEKNNQKSDTTTIIDPFDIITGSDDIEVQKMLMINSRDSVLWKKYQYPNGDIFEGNFQNNKQEGYGRFNFANGQTYEGFFQNGMRHGFGIYTWPDGGSYEGFWRDDKRHGKGIYTDRFGQTSEGEYVNDKRQCQLNWQRVEL